MKEKILIYPGSFDPFHKGHLETAKLAIETYLEFTSLMFLLQHNAFKTPPYFSTIFKEELIKKHIENNFKIPTRIHSTIYTTLFEYLLHHRYFELDSPKFYILIGDDVLDSIDKWSHFKEEMRLCEYIVISRTKTKEEIVKQYKKLNMEKVRIIESKSSIDYSSTQIRTEVDEILKKFL